MKKKHVVKSYEPTTDGYSHLYSEDPILAEASRDVTFLFLPHHFNKKDEETKLKGYDALVYCANLAGFRVKTFVYRSGESIKIGKRFPKHRDQAFYSTLFSDFKNDIKAIEYNPDDEHGICDETVKVANIVYKYKNIIVLRRKKKTVFEKVKLFYKNIFVK
jgi:hypothetical protein